MHIIDYTERTDDFQTVFGEFEY